MWREVTFESDEVPAGELVIEDDRCRILVDPLRWNILQSLQETSTIGGLSEKLQITDARVLAHALLLEEAQVLSVDKSGASPRDWKCSPCARRIRVRFELPPCPEDKAISHEVSAQFNQALREVDDDFYGPDPVISINHNGARLSTEQAREFGQRLLALIEEYFPPGKGDSSGIKYGFHGVLTPIDLHPFQDGGTDS